MSKRELIVRELDGLPEQDLDRLLGFLHSIKEDHAESALSKDWLTPEEDAAWASL